MGVHRRAGKGRDHNGGGGTRQADGQCLKRQDEGDSRTSGEPTRGGLLTGAAASHDCRQTTAETRFSDDSVTCSLQINARGYIQNE